MRKRDVIDAYGSGVLVLLPGDFWPRRKSILPIVSSLCITASTAINILPIKQFIYQMRIFGYYARLLLGGNHRHHVRRYEERGLCTPRLID